MQQRVEAHDSLDDFPTPPWATRGIVRWLADNGLADPGMTVREPCANRGYMVRPLAEFFAHVEASDVHDYGAGFAVADYLFGLDPAAVDATFMNPPFRLAEQFIQRALRTSGLVAAIVRSAFTEGIGRHDSLFSKNPPCFIVQHVERVPMCKGKYDPTIASATAYCWLIWTPARTGDTRYRWLAPCRKALERAADAAPLFAGAGV